MRRERRGEKREERRERTEDDPRPKYPDRFRAWGVIILAVYLSVFAFGFVDHIRLTTRDPLVICSQKIGFYP